MKLSCTQENLSKGIQLTAHLAGKNPSLPILNNLLLRATPTGLEIVSTNLEMGVQCFVRAKVEEQGDIAVPAKLLSEYISLLPHQKVDLVAKDHELQLQCENFQTVLRGQAGEEYPVLPEVQSGVNFQVLVADLKRAISETAFAVAYDDTRPEISGILLHYSQKELIAVATDSYRLAEKKIPYVQAPQSEGRVIVPGRAWQEVIRLLPEQTESPVSITVSENQIVFIVDDVKFVSRLIEGQYPDYQQIIPQKNVTSFTIAREDFSKAIKTASLFSKSGINDVVLDVQPAEKRCIISSSNSQVGENTIVLNTNVIGEPLSVVFNHRYLLDGVVNIRSEEITLSFVDQTSPGSIRPKDDERYLYIVMPIKQ